MAVPRPLFFMFLILSVSCGNKQYRDGEQEVESDEDDLDAENDIENETEGDKGEEMGEGERSSQAQDGVGEDVLDLDDEENENRRKRSLISLESMSRKNAKAKNDRTFAELLGIAPTVAASLENTSLIMTPGAGPGGAEIENEMHPHPHKRVKRFRSAEWKAYRNFCRGQRTKKYRVISRNSCARKCKRNKNCISFSFIVRTKWRNCYFFNTICRKIGRLRDYRSYTYVQRKYLPKKPRRSRGWKPWGSWSSCQPSCGRRRSRKRYRKCSRGPCRGRKYQWRRCKSKSCSSLSRPMSMAQGHWGAWSSWPTCPVTCDGSTIKRNRKCYHTNFGLPIKKAPCPGKSVHYKKCNIKPCPSLSGPISMAKGHWGVWSSWPPCPVTCNGSTIKRSRKCYHTNFGLPIKKAPCPGKSVHYKKCNTKACPSLSGPMSMAKGHWGAWSSWPPCPVTCDGSTIKRSRKCYHTNFGLPIKKAPCPGMSVQFKECNTKPCPKAHETKTDEWQDWEEVH